MSASNDGSLKSPAGWSKCHRTTPVFAVLKLKIAATTGLARMHANSESDGAERIGAVARDIDLTGGGGGDLTNVYVLLLGTSEMAPLPLVGDQVILPN